MTLRALGPLALLATLALPAASAEQVNVGDDLLVAEVTPGWGDWGGYVVRVSSEEAPLLVGVWCFAGATTGCIYFGGVLVGPLFGGCVVASGPTTAAGCGDIRVGTALVILGSSDACASVNVYSIGLRRSACVL